MLARRALARRLSTEPSADIMRKLNAIEMQVSKGVVFETRKVEALEKIALAQTTRDARDRSVLGGVAGGAFLFTWGWLLMSWRF